MKDFRTQYYARYNTSNGASEEEDENLVPRSFTDDPEIPLKQIRVRAAHLTYTYGQADNMGCMEYTYHKYIHIRS